MVTGVDFVDFHAALAARSPSQLGIVDVVIRLLRALEEYHGSVEAGGAEVLRPVRFGPRLGGFSSSGHGLQAIVQRTRGPIEAFAHAHSSEPAQPLPPTEQVPAPTAVSVLQNPGIEDRKEADFLSLGFEKQYHLLRDLTSATHGGNEVRSRWLHRTHASHMLLGQGT